MKWVRTEVDLDKHIVIPKLDSNMDSPDQFVEDYIYNLSKTTIDKSQPLWDLLLLNVKTSDAEAIGVFRIHHSLAWWWDISHVSSSGLHSTNLKTRGFANDSSSEEKER